MVCHDYTYGCALFHRICYACLYVYSSLAWVYTKSVSACLLVCTCTVWTCPPTSFVHLYTHLPVYMYRGTCTCTCIHVLTVDVHVHIYMCTCSSKHVPQQLIKDEYRGHVHSCTFCQGCVWCACVCVCVCGTCNRTFICNVFAWCCS